MQSGQPDIEGQAIDNSQRQLPTDHNYAVSTREYQTDQSSVKPARQLLALSSETNKSNDKNKLTDSQTRRVDTVTPYQGNALNEFRFGSGLRISTSKRHRVREYSGFTLNRQSAFRGFAGFGNIDRVAALDDCHELAELIAINIRQGYEW
jgi:hypothetical protein